MPEDITLKTLHATVHCYLSLLQTIADVLGQACPPVGGPYRHRLSRLRARLAFDSSAAAIEESCELTAKELQEYADNAALYVERHSVELRRGIAGLEDTVRTLSQRQDYYSARLRQFLVQVGTGPHPGPDANALSCIESMSNETHSLLNRMRDEMARVERRLDEAEITDPITGLMNRREMERRIAAAQTGGESPVLLLFEFRQDLPAEVAQQVAARLGSQFRHKDLVSRWDDRQFLVLFQGKAETASLRAQQVEPWIAGRYLLDNGATLETAVEARLFDLEPAPAH
jgi:GGDEF domain-containing protein